MTIHRTGRRARITAAGTPSLGDVMSNNPQTPEVEPGFVPPAAMGLPAGTLESAETGANRLDAWARTPQGRNFLAHALVQLARDGWLRLEVGEGFEPMPEQHPAVLPAVPVPPTTHATPSGAADYVSVGELAHAIDNSTPYPVELDAALCRFMAERLLEMLAIVKRSEHAVWQPDEEPPPGPQPQPEDPSSLPDEEASRD